MSGARVKRLLESSSGSEEEEAKVQKVANPTDHLVTKKEEKKKEVMACFLAPHRYPTIRDHNGYGGGPKFPAS